MDIKFTNKQIEIMNVIKDANEDGTLCSVYDIQEKVSYDVKRDALLHSLKILIDNGFVDRRGREIRNGKSVRIFGLSTKAAEFL